MAAIGGRKARVMYGANTIANLEEFNLGGVEVDLQETTAFGDTVEIYIRAGIDGAGTVSFRGNYDPADTNGQVAINTLKAVNDGLTNLYFYTQYGAGAAGATYEFWRVASGGEIFITKFNALNMPKNGIGKINFTGQISGTYMERVTSWPTGVAAGEYIFVSDPYNNKIYKFDLDGVLQTTYSELASNELAALTGIAVDGDGNMFTSDVTVYGGGSEENTIRKHDTSGNLLTSWGLYGSGDEECAQPNAIKIDGDGNILIADTANNRIQKFGPSGTFISKFGVYGDGEGQLDLPGDIDVDADGNVYVANTDNHCILKFNSSGVLQWESGSYGSGDGQFISPNGIALDSDGNIYVSDTGNYRIQKLNSSGEYQSQWGSYGTGDGEFDDTGGIDIDSSDNIYVVDTYNTRVQVFDTDGVYQNEFALDETSECAKICIKSIS